MIEKTVFECESEIINKVKEIYGIEIRIVKKVNRGSANIYELDNQKYILKEFQSKYTKAKIEKEISVIKHLSKKKINVPEYIKCLDGKYSFDYKNRIIIMQKFIEGYTIEPNTGDYKKTLESAKYLGKIVNALEDFTYELPINKIIYTNQDLEKSVEKYKTIISQLNHENEIDNKIIKDLKAKIDMINNISTKIDLYNFNKLTYKNTHGDYSVMQFIYKNDKINAIIDFVSACNMPIVWEVIRSYSYIDENAKSGVFDIDIFVCYVKEFCKYVKLNKYDIENMVNIYLLQILTSNYGYKQFLNDRNNCSLLEFAFFRTNICRYLYKNESIITERLMQEIIT